MEELPMADIGTSSESMTSAVQKWRCDVCKVRFFEDFDEACAHEAECQKNFDAEKSLDASSSSCTIADKAKAPIAAMLVTQDTIDLKPENEKESLSALSSSVPIAFNSIKSTPLPLDVKEKEATNKEAKQKPPSPIITPTKTPAKSSRSNSKSLSKTRIDGKEKTERKGARTNDRSSHTGGHRNNNNNSNNAVIPLVQVIKDAMFQKIKPMKESSLTEEDVGSLGDMLQKLESLDVNLEVLQITLIGTVVSKFKKHPTLGPTAKTLVQEWKAIAKKSEAAAKLKAIEAKQRTAKPKEQQKKQQHAFFNPRSSSSTKPKTTKSNVPINPFFAPRKKTPSPADAVMEETRSLKRKLPPKEDAVRLSPETTKAVAAIFQNKSTKQIIAEQRKAELAANREAERKREKERSAKRAAMFGGKAKDTIGSGAAFANKSLLPLAPRFPVPNHVTVNNDENAFQVLLSDHENIIFPENHPFRSTAQTKEELPKSATPRSWLSSSSALDTADVNATTFTAIQRALFDTFSILPKNNIHQDAQNNNLQLWNDSIKTMDVQGIVGSETRKVFFQLAEFIDHWRVARNESLERTAERHRKLAKGKKSKKKTKKRQRKTYDYYEDDDWLVGDDVEDPDDPLCMAPLCLLVGAHSSGKTSIVHSVAKHCGDCKVLEINTSRARNGASLKHAIEEATQSNSSLEMLQNKTNNSDANNFFGASKPVAKKKIHSGCTMIDSDSENDEPEDKKKSSVTIILIDEVDILFEEADAGFWPALWALARATKCPIVLTANECPPQLQQGSRLPCKRFWLDRPHPDDCAAKLWSICRNQASALQIRPQLAAKGPEAIQKQLAAIATSCDCDLRKLYHELQVYVALASSGLSTESWPVTKPKSSDVSTVSKVIKSSLILDVPRIVSLEPSRIPMNQHSIVVAKGSNFKMLINQRETADTQIRIGPRLIAEWHVVDDNTLLIQCPPFIASKEDPEWESNPAGRWLKRIFPLSIDLCNSECLQPALKCASRTLVSHTLADGSNLEGTYCPMIEYTISAQDAAVAFNGNNDDGEAEFESTTSKSNEQIDSVERLPVEKNSTDEDGTTDWKATIEKAAKNSELTRKVDPPKTTPNDVATASELEFLAQRYRDASDAAFLEDFGDGLPYLSGACRGFAYDYTEDGCASYQQGGADTLKMHEKSKPLREEKLFALGWKDNCCFYGNAETYMTLPSISQRKQAKQIMNHFRGDEGLSGRAACENATGTGSSATATTLLSEDLHLDSAVFREDLDEFVHHQATLDDSSPGVEDAYLPRAVSQLVLDLPEMLRTRSTAEAAGGHFVGENEILWGALETHRSQTFNQMVKETTNYILPSLSLPSNLSRWSYGRFGFDKNHGEQQRLILECLPALRRIGVLERCAEFVHEQQLAASALNENEEGQFTSLRRSTRRVTRAAPKQRLHYFDKVSTILRKDEADLETSEVGELFAKQWQSCLVHPFGRKTMEKASKYAK